MIPGDRRDQFETRFYERLTLLRAVQVIVSVALLLTLGAALLEWLIEPQTFGSFGDACWSAVVTVSTAGYGDLVPQTVAGRMVAAWVMVAALAWVPAVTAVVMTLHGRKHDERRRAATTSADATWSGWRKSSSGSTDSSAGWDLRCRLPQPSVRNPAGGREGGREPSPGSALGASPRRRTASSDLRRERVERHAGRYPRLRVGCPPRTAHRPGGGARPEGTSVRYR